MNSERIFVNNKSFLILGKDDVNGVLRLWIIKLIIWIIQRFGGIKIMNTGMPSITFIIGLQALLQIQKAAIPPPYRETKLYY